MSGTTPSYYPSEPEAQQFWSRLRSEGNVITGVPPGFPTRLVSPLAWAPASVAAKQRQWTLEMTKEDAAAIDGATRSFEAKYDDLSAISSSTFELPEELSLRLKRISDQLYHGVGFQIIRGLDPSGYTPVQNLTIYAGLAAHICPQRGFVDQACKGVVARIAHVVNVQGSDHGPSSTAPGFSNTPLSFHSDCCEIMAFHYLDTAPEGGETVLSSSWQTYNELAEKCPQVLHTLAEPWVMDTSVTVASQKGPELTRSSFKPYAEHPPRHVRMLERVDSDKILLRFSRYGVTGWQRMRNPDLPTPTQAQLDALDAVQSTGQANGFPLPIAKGDMLFVNDMAIMHARRGFSEHGQYLKRHLVKMFFHDPAQGWTVPASVEGERERMYGPNRPDGSRSESWHAVYEDGLEEASMMNG
ncbi:hypothetical protein LTR53_000334 [Teratosphaeriaceae sp. CCFEE 6253]|nr:hypothetical protein LTR53_000334 [Teratosphaeriaceae sp. CCFEE 6253]